eukprot:548035-Pelagomonas_calceolata.AAC.1
MKRESRRQRKLSLHHLRKRIYIGSEKPRALPPQGCKTKNADGNLEGCWKHLICASANCAPSRHQRSMHLAAF